MDKEINNLKKKYPNLKIHHSKSYAPLGGKTREAWFIDSGLNPDGSYDQLLEINENQFEKLKQEGYQEH